MQCPLCKEVNLVLAERQGIEIDYCPQCRGVWLDRGELDKMIERSASQAPPQHDRGIATDPQRGKDKRGHHYKKRKPKSLLKELFDF